MILKKLLLITTALALPFLSGCWSSHEVNSLGISVCIGIDKADKGFCISEQIINPKAVASKKSSNEAPVAVYSLEGENITEIITRMTTLVSRKIYSSHLRMVILSEEIAQAGIAPIADYLLRYFEYRTDFCFAIAKGSSAKEILSILTPIEAIPGVDMFNKLKMSHDEWAPTKDMRIIELANDICTEGRSPVIAAISKVDDSTRTDSTDVLRKTGKYEMLKFADMGIFKKDKLVGWLNEETSKGYSYMTNNVKRTSGFNTAADGVEIADDVLKASAKIKATVTDNQPRIDVLIKIDYVITEVKGHIDVSQLENLDIINKIPEEKITRICQEAVKTAQSFQADIFGFGDRIHNKYPRYWATVKGRWNEVFETLPITVKVSAKMVSTGDLTKTLT